MKLDVIKEAITELTADERATLAAWIAEQQMDDWDKQMRKDFSPGGRGMPLVEKVRASVRVGKFSPMDSAKR